MGWGWEEGGGFDTCLFFSRVIVHNGVDTLSFYAFILNALRA